MYPETQEVKTPQLDPSSGQFLLASEEVVWRSHEKFGHGASGDCYVIVDAEDGGVQVREVYWGPRGGRYVQCVSFKLDAWEQVVAAVAEARKAGAR